MPILQNPDTGRFELSFRPSADPEPPLVFEMNKKAAEALYSHCSPEIND